MKFKDVDDAVYFCRFNMATEKIIKDISCTNFIKYLKENAIGTDVDFICIDDKQAECIKYTIREEEGLRLRDFLVTYDDRVFYHRYLGENHELVDCEKDEKTMNEKYKEEYKRLKYDFSIGLYNKSRMAFAIQYGRLLAFLELSVFTSIERDNEEDKLHKLYSDWEKRYYSNEEKINEKI